MLYWQGRWWRAVGFTYPELSIRTMESSCCPLVATKFLAKIPNTPRNWPAKNKRKKNERGKKPSVNMCHRYRTFWQCVNMIALYNSVVFTILRFQPKSSCVIKVGKQKNEDEWARLLRNVSTSSCAQSYPLPRGRTFECARLSPRNPNSTNVTQTLSVIKTRSELAR